MITFRMSQHHVRPDVPIVEVLINREVSATLVPGDTDAELRFYTRHLDSHLVHHMETDVQTETTLHVIQIFLKRKD